MIAEINLDLNLLAESHRHQWVQTFLGNKTSFPESLQCKQAANGLFCKPFLLLSLSNLALADS